MGRTAERRVEERQPCQSRLFIQITACAEADLVGTTFSCHSQDVSSDGMCITSEAFVPVGAKLDLWVENDTRPGKYFLTSDVRWVAPMDGNRCCIGLGITGKPHDRPRTLAAGPLNESPASRFTGIRPF